MLIDAPGHTEFLRNMITGRLTGGCAILIIDAAEGVREQSRHGYLLHLLGVRQVAVVVNKMDRVGYDAGRFADIEREITGYLAGLGVVATAVIPISARNGDGVSRRTDAIGCTPAQPYWRPLTSSFPLLPCKPHVEVTGAGSLQVRRTPNHRGRIETGSIAVGDEIAIMPATNGPS